MKIDFLHNAIVARTITEGFKEAVLSSVIPAIVEEYGDSLIGVQMYSDYLSEGFSSGKTRYYPLSVKTADGVFARWMCWTVRKGAFEGNSPFAYIGSAPLEIMTCDAPPSKEGFKVKYFDEKTVRINVQTTAPDITVLSGKYSQSFVDEMAVRLTALISDAFGIRGIEDSNIELALVFAPETYMEHTSDNITYRRLLFVDRGAAPRDLWIKWRGLSGRAYSMADDASDDLVLELGEDVPQKIKEKEYRFLTRVGKDDYHTAMGRKNVTEWRIVLKRAIKRGDLVLINRPDATLVKRRAAEPAFIEREEAVSVSSDNRQWAPEAAAESSESAVLVESAVSAAVDYASAEISEPAAHAVFGEETLATEILPEAFVEEAEGIISKAADELDDDDELAAVMEMAKRALSDLGEESDELGFSSNEEKSPTDRFISDDDSREIDEITKMALEALRLAERGVMDDEDEPEAGEGEIPEVPVADEIIEPDEADGEAAEPDKAIEDEEIYEEISDDDAEGECDGESSAEFVPVVVPEDPTEEEYTDGERENTAAAAKPAEDDVSLSLEERLRKEIEAKLRLEYELEAKRRAEAEAERLRAEQVRLELENKKLIEDAQRSRETWERQEALRREESERLKAQIEAKLRQEAKERERLAEAARLAVEEQQRLEAEKIREEKARLEALKAAAEAEKAREAERLAEEQRRAELARIEAERAQVQSASQGSSATAERSYTYISKTVTLMFRKSVDPNMVARIHEILKATLEYYGKQSVHMRVKASIPNSMTVKMEFVQFPKEEMELLGNMIKVLGNSNLGIAKAVVD